MAKTEGNEKRLRALLKDDLQDLENVDDNLSSISYEAEKLGILSEEGSDYMFKEVQHVLDALVENFEWFIEEHLKIKQDR